MLSVELPGARPLRGGPLPEPRGAPAAASSCSGLPSETPVYSPSESSADSASPTPAHARAAPASSGTKPCISAC